MEEGLCTSGKAMSREGEEGTEADGGHMASGHQGEEDHMIGHLAFHQQRLLGFCRMVRHGLESYGHQKLGLWWFLATYLGNKCTA